MQQVYYRGSCKVQPKSIVEMLKKYLDNYIEQRSMTYGKSNAKTRILGYTDNDWAESINDIRNILGDIFHLILDYSLGHLKSKSL